MPKLKETPTQRMNKAFLAAVRAGQIVKGDKNADTIKLVSVKYATFFRKMKAPETFSVFNARILAQRYMNDRQLCEAFGVEYHGATPE